MIKSPCINVCSMDNGKCVGCKRSLRQIVDWMVYTDEEKKKAIQEIKETEDDKSDDIIQNRCDTDNGV